MIVLSRLPYTMNKLKNEKEIHSIKDALLFESSQYGIGGGDTITMMMDI